MNKTKSLKARGVRLSNVQWAWLKKKSGKNATPSDLIRLLIDGAMKNK